MLLLVEKLKAELQNSSTVVDEQEAKLILF
jgi:hypothetical protein